jgi:hypothetical protein
VRENDGGMDSRSLHSKALRHAHWTGCVSMQQSATQADASRLLVR